MNIIAILNILRLLVSVIRQNGSMNPELDEIERLIAEMETEAGGSVLPEVSSEEAEPDPE